MRDLLAFPDDSRVWIYQANQPIPESEIGMVNAQVSAFAKEWVSHNRALHATGGLLHDVFLVLVADESQAGASGCSIDASVRFIRGIGEQYQRDFFDRLQFAFLDQGTVRFIHRDALPEAYQSGLINDETLFFDNLVKTKRDFINHWLTPFGHSWLKRFI